jgi:hypothetical protein
VIVTRDDDEFFSQRPGDGQGKHAERIEWSGDRLDAGAWKTKGRNERVEHEVRQVRQAV